MAKLRSCIKALPLNDKGSLGMSDRCPRCKQVHLRPGFCQALVDWSQYTIETSYDVTPVTEPVTRNADVTPERNANADRQARYRARKRAEAGAE
jgi:Zn-finger nucleic acid-binding protein